MQGMAFEQHKGFFSIDEDDVFGVRPNEVDMPNWHEFVGVNGFCRRNRWPSVAGDHDVGDCYICVWERPEHEKWKYMLEINDVTGGLEVFVSDEPSMVVLFLQLVQAVTAAETNGAREMHSVMNKWFRAEHGHEGHDICSRCAPHEWESLQRRRAESAKRKVMEKPA